MHPLAIRAPGHRSPAAFVPISSPHTTAAPLLLLPPAGLQPSPSNSAEKMCRHSVPLLQEMTIRSISVPSISNTTSPKDVGQHEAWNIPYFELILKNTPLYQIVGREHNHRIRRCTKHPSHQDWARPMSSACEAVPEHHLCRTPVCTSMERGQQLSPQHCHSLPQLVSSKSKEHLGMLTAVLPGASRASLQLEDYTAQCAPRDAHSSTSSHNTTCSTRQSRAPRSESGDLQHSTKPQAKMQPSTAARSSLPWDFSTVTAF